MRASPMLTTLAAAVSLTASSPTFALDLMQAWRAALANDAQLASARSQLQATRERVPQARAGLLPSVNATAAISPQSVDTNVGPSRDFTARTYAIQLSYPRDALLATPLWIVLVAVLAALPPAWRAARVPPAHAVRFE